MIKLSNKAHKLSAPNGELLSALLLKTFSNETAKKLINHEVTKRAEQRKGEAIDGFIEGSRKRSEWWYLASSHYDCADDHKPYQARLYIDEKAPEEELKQARSMGIYTVQWVMGGPAWFITRPNCRHYFVSLTSDKVKNKSVKSLIKKYKTHSIEGDYTLKTPRRIAIEEYTDRIRYLRALYREYPTKHLKTEINKAEMLLEKWKDYKYNKNKEGA